MQQETGLEPSTPQAASPPLRQPAGAKRLVARTLVKARGLKQPARKPRKLSAFDQDVLKLIRRGTRRLQDIIGLLGVDGQQTRQRVEKLEELGLVKPDSADPQLLSITVKAYNEFKPKSLELSTERKARPRRAPQALVQQPAQAPARQAPVAQEVADNRAARGQVDLMELLAKGAPRQEGASQVLQTTQRTPVPAGEQPLGKSPLATPSTPGAGGSDACELCKEEFRLAMVDGNPKYGHCFCGAAYHKDCYEGMLGADGLCVRCGRKLDLALQKETKDAMKKIRSVFGD